MLLGQLRDKLRWRTRFVIRGWLNAIPRQGVIFKRFTCVRRINTGRHHDIWDHPFVLSTATIDSVELLDGVLHMTKRFIKQIVDMVQ